MTNMISAAVLAATMTTAASQPVYRVMPASGVRHYQYEVVQTINGTTRKGYRTDFDLETKDGQLFAIVRATSELNEGAWKPVVPDANCRKAMNGGSDSLARVKLYSPAGDVHDLGAPFLALCAPSAVFFPLTDILNAAIIPLPGLFRATELREVGESLPFAGFDAAYDRAGESIHETAAGGLTSLAALDSTRATIEWRPQPAELTTIDRNMQSPMTLQGVEHWAFRAEVDRRTGVLERASTTYDDLDLKIVGAPDNVPHIRIAREVTIERR